MNELPGSSDVLYSPRGGGGVSTQWQAQPGSDCRGDATSFAGCNFRAFPPLQYECKNQMKADPRDYVWPRTPRPVR